MDWLQNLLFDENSIEYRETEETETTCIFGTYAFGNGRIGD